MRLGFILAVSLLFHYNGISHGQKLDTSLSRSVSESLNAVSNSGAIDQEKDLEQPEAPLRTATGGIINSILVFLSIVAFIGNGVFMVNVFWFSK